MTITELSRIYQSKKQPDISQNIRNNSDKVLEAQPDGWYVSGEAHNNGVEVAGEVEVSEDDLRRNDDLGMLINKAFGFDNLSSI